MGLIIRTLAGREPIEPGTIRPYLPCRTSEDYGDHGYAIIVEPVTPDILGADGDDKYGTLRIITDAGVRVVRTTDVGVLVLPVE